MSTSKLYYDHARPSAFSTLNKLAAAVLKKNKSDVRACLEQQHANTLHNPEESVVPQPYTVTKVMDVGDCELLVVKSLTK